MATRILSYYHYLSLLFEGKTAGKRENPYKVSLKNPKPLRSSQPWKESWSQSNLDRHWPDYDVWRINDPFLHNVYPDHVAWDCTVLVKKKHERKRPDLPEGFGFRHLRTRRATNSDRIGEKNTPTRTKRCFDDCYRCSCKLISKLTNPKTNDALGPLNVSINKCSPITQPQWRSYHVS